MQIAKSAACQTFTASRDNGMLIVVEKIELHCTMETGRQSQSSSKITEKKMVYSKTASCLIDLHAGFIYARKKYVVLITVLIFLPWQRNLAILTQHLFLKRTCISSNTRIIN